VLLEGENTSTAQVLAVMEKADIFAFFGHGERIGAGTALKLNATNSLTAADISRQQFPRLQLAMLAGCSSGAAEYGVMDTNNLVHALLAKGVPSVVASQWDVDGEQTNTMMKIFVDSLLQGENAALALAKAQRKFLSKAETEFSQKTRKQPDHRHPYYWAGFGVTGRSI
jgi:CHAT domain-containing protein